MNWDGLGTVIIAHIGVDGITLHTIEKESADNAIPVVGGSPLALRTAQQLEHNYAVTLVIKDEDIAKKFVELLKLYMVSYKLKRKKGEVLFRALGFVLAKRW